MFKVIVLYTIMLLTGCYQSVTTNDIQRADKFCKSKNQEIVEILSLALGAEQVVCSDGKTSPNL